MIYPLEKKGFINPKANFYQLNIHSPEVKTILEKEKINVINHHAAKYPFQNQFRPLFDANPIL
ncbi:MAG: hypothetical protein CM1200mP16_15880 [Nitrospina sp.]|nr:MAG: hypothetical protein CM1200mP16_15880 [Nitrospina sp.]